MANKVNLQFEEEVSDRESAHEVDEVALRVKKLIRKANWNYLSKHPEIRAIIRVLLHELLNTKPTNVYQAAANLFDSNKLDELIKVINDQLTRINAELKKNIWSEYDGDMHFERMGDADCDHSRCLLEFALVGEPCPLHPKEN